MEKIKRKPIRRKARWVKKTKPRKEDIYTRLRFKRKPGIDGSTHHISEILPHIIKEINEECGK